MKKITHLILSLLITLIISSRLFWVTWNESNETNLNLNNRIYRIKTSYDHRLSMVGIVLGLTLGGKIIVEDCHSIATSFPNFLNLMKQLGAKYEIIK